MEETTENKNTGYKAAIIILFAVLVISNVTQTVLHNDIENRWSMERRSLI
ncbi:MAG: hypothetical protein IMZ52_04450 [Actinobacteria bacterium]|nr:hypothetical protein [Actinomycetota bacterium]